MGLRYNPPPGWPPAPPGFTPAPGWQPNPSWPPPPPGWQLWVNDDQRPGPLTTPPVPGHSTGSATGAGAYGGGGYGNPGRPYGGGGKISGWAVASFILGLIGVGFLFSLIFAAVALSRIKRLGQRGKGLAIAGIVLSAAWVALFITLAAIGSAGQTSSPASTRSVTHTGQLSVFSPAAGDCFDNPAGASGPAPDLTSSLRNS
jgi:hypothetical protein